MVVSANVEVGTADVVVDTDGTVAELVEVPDAVVGVAEATGASVARAGPSAPEHEDTNITRATATASLPSITPQNVPNEDGDDLNIAGLGS